MSRIKILMWTNIEVNVAIICGEHILEMLILTIALLLTLPFKLVCHPSAPYSLHCPTS